MNAVLQEKFDGLETALNKLLDSITTYNPSTAAAHDLLAAEVDLTEGLEQLAQHQTNHKRILALRQTADQLDAQIKSTIRTLAETRKELLDTPFTTFDESSRNVPLETILSYATQIAPFTVPPTSTTSSVPTEEPVVIKVEATSSQILNGTAVSPPAPGTSPNTGIQTPADALAPATESHRDPGFVNLMGGLKAVLEAQRRVPFVPWPDENRMRASSLMVLQQAGKVDDTAAMVTGEDEELNAEGRRKDALVAVKNEEGENVTTLGFAASEDRTQTRKHEEFRGFALYDEDDE